MKAYVASILTQRHLVQEIQVRLESLGYQIVLDWTTRPDNKPYEEHASLAAQDAKEIMDGLEDLDLLVIVGSETGGRGMYVELGACLMHHQIHKRPRIIAMGPHINNSIFYFHPKVERAHDIEEMVAMLTHENL